MGVSREALCDELKRLADELGHSPTIRELDEISAYARSAYMREFGTPCLKLAGLAPKQLFTIPVDALIAEVQRLAEELGEKPRATDMRDQDEILTAGLR